MRRLGQHFLINAQAIQKIVRALQIESHETLIEIGPGHGELTVPLLHAARPLNCRVVVIEKDESLAKEIKKTLGGDVQVVHGNALTIIPNVVSGLQSTASPYKLVGNIPYYITGFLLRTIGLLDYKPRLVVLTLQKEVALRLLATPPKMNRLAVSVLPWATPTLITTLSRSDFSPPPNVESAVVALRIKPWTLPATYENYDSALRAVFAHPRKTIANNLALHQKESVAAVSALLKTLNIEPTLRPHNISHETLGAIAVAFSIKQNN
jgi:16S rRNA (adenine1518-N6/adenine1519-N6)-dimethyltransferase